MGEDETDLGNSGIGVDPFPGSCAPFEEHMGTMRRIGAFPACRQFGGTEMGGGILRSGASVKLLAVGLAFAVACGSVPAHAGPSFYFRAKATLITLPQPEEDNIEVALEAPSPFGLTTGVAVSIPLSVTGNADGVTYRAASEFPCRFLRTVKRR